MPGMRGWAWLVVVSACYEPRVPPGSPCDPGACPEELVCSPATHTCEPVAIDAGDDAPQVWLEGYAHRKRVTIAPTAAALAAVPVSVAIADAQLAASARTDGADIAFTSSDATTLLETERVAYTAATGALEAWVRTDLAAGTPTTLYMYYGGPAAPPSPSPWSAIHAGVWHMDGTGNVVADSAAKPHAATAATTDARPAPTAGIAGAARSYDGIDDAMTVGDPNDGSLDFGATSFSYTLWVNVASSGGPYDLPLHKGGSSLGQIGYDLELGTGDWNACISDGAAVKCVAFGDEAQLLGRWVSLAAVVDRATARLRVYVDGVEVRSTDITGVGSLSTDRLLAFGLTSDRFQGLLDEVRIYTTAVSASWLAATRANLASRASFMTFGAEESSPGP